MNRFVITLRIALVASIVAALGFFGAQSASAHYSGYCGHGTVTEWTWSGPVTVKFIKSWTDSSGGISMHKHQYRHTPKIGSSHLENKTCLPH